MMRPKRLAYTLVTQAINNICLSQTPGAAGNLTIAGALASGNKLPRQTLGYIIGVGCAGNDAARTFTVTGFNADNQAQTETIAGANIATTAGTKFWREITTISVDAACAGAIVIGTVNTVLSAVTPTIPLGMGEPYTRTAIDISGTINFTVQKCYERPTAGETPNWLTHQAAGVVDVQTLETGPLGAVRVQINTYTSGATLAFAIIQSQTSAPIQSN